MLLNLPPEIQELIFDYLDLQSQLRLRRVCKSTTNLAVTNFWDLPSLIKPWTLTENILRGFPQIKYLNLYDNKMVTDINFLTKITVLNIGGLCTINDSGIINLRNLCELYAENNFNIHNLENKPNIKYLDASGNCGITNDDIVGLHLKELYCVYNPKIN